jgi:starch phosphorylase
VDKDVHSQYSANGLFSSDRAIREYCQDIWNIQPVSVELEDYVQAQAGFQVDSQRLTTTS